MESNIFYQLELCPKHGDSTTLVQASYSLNISQDYFTNIIINCVTFLICNAHYSKVTEHNIQNIAVTYHILLKMDLFLMFGLANNHDKLGSDKLILNMIVLTH